MQENYIHIYTSYLSDLLLGKKISFEQTRQLLTYFEKECEKINSRQELIKFLDKYLFYFPQLEELKRRLLDNNFVFPTPPEPEE